MGVELALGAIAVISAGTSIHNAEQQKKAAKKNAKLQAEEQRRQARIAQAKATREARIKAARTQAMGASSGVGGSVIESPVQSYQSTAEGNIFNIGEAAEYNIDAIKNRRDSIVDSATNSQIKAVADFTGDMMSPKLFGSKPAAGEKGAGTKTGPFEWTDTESGL